MLYTYYKFTMNIENKYLKIYIQSIYIFYYLVWSHVNVNVFEHGNLQKKYFFIR